MKVIPLEYFKEGYFILYANNGSWYNNLVEKYQLRMGFPETDAEYTHIELCLGDFWSINPVFPKIKINEDLRIKHGMRYAKIIRPKINGYDERRHEIAIQGCKRVNTVYGLGVIWFLIKDKIKNNIFSVIGDFCSELAGWVILKVFSKNSSDWKKYLPLKYDQLTPADWSLHTEFFEVVAEGYIRDLNKGAHK